MCTSIRLDAKILSPLETSGDILLKSRKRASVENFFKVFDNYDQIELFHFSHMLLLDSFKSAYSLIWGAHQILGQGKEGL